jgi:hypothetical protein
LWQGGTFVINNKSLEIRKLPMNKFAHDPRKNLVSICVHVRGVMNVYAEKNPPSTIDPMIEASGQEQSNISYTSDSYQKILDYHIVDIFLTTVVFGVIILLRLHH